MNKPTGVYWAEAWGIFCKRLGEINQEGLTMGQWRGQMKEMVEQIYMLGYEDGANAKHSIRPGCTEPGGHR